MDPLIITVGFKGASHSVQLPPSATLGDLAKELARQCSVDPQTIKLLAPGRAGMIKTAEEPQRALQESGILPGSRLKMMASAAADVAAVRGARDLPGLAPLDHELRREIARRTPPASPPSGRVREANPYSFGRLQTWEYPRLKPPPSEALKLLQRIASDPGIVGVMAKHRWRVGLLSEMPPEGYVGVDPVCILGFNRNRGQEISLRLRTDDLKGFRRYDRILETMLHELAHMVHDEHDSHFKDLNSQLRREAAQLSWHSAPAARTATGAVFDGLVKYDLPSAEQDAMAATAALSGRSLRELAHGPGGAGSPPMPARDAAAQAALQRALQVAAANGRDLGLAGQTADDYQANGSGSSNPPEVQGALYPAADVFGQRLQQERQYNNGDLVWYRERDGSWLATEVVHVEHGVDPPSYGISIPSHAGAGGSGDAGGTGFRETEGSRLRPRAGGEASQPGTEASVGAGHVEGLGHFDSSTAAKEEQVYRLLEG